MADFFLKIDGITGEAQVQDHKDEIEVLSFSYEGSHGTSVSYGQGLSLGSGSVQPFRITKFVDISSPLFLQACAAGKDLGTVTFTARRPITGNKRVDYLKYTLDEGVMVSRVAATGHTGMDQGGQAVLPVEEVDLAFQKITCEYVQVGSKGETLKTTSAGYHFVQEQVV